MKLIINKTFSRGCWVLIICLSALFSPTSFGQTSPESIPVIFGIHSVNPVEFDELGLPVEIDTGDIVKYSLQINLLDTVDVSSIEVRLGKSSGANDIFFSDEDYSNYTDTTLNTFFRSGNLLKNSTGNLDFDDEIFYEISIYDLPGNCAYKGLGVFND